MNLENFQQILLASVSGDPTEAHQAIAQFQQEYYPDYINFNLQSLINPINERIPPIAIIYLYREVSSRQLFKYPELTLHFIQNFAENVTTQFCSPTIPDNFKMMLAYILALLHLYIRRVNQNMSILQYLFTTFNSIPDLRKYIMKCLTEIALSSPDYGGVQLDDMMKVVLEDMQNMSLFVIRYQLFMALAKNNLENEGFHQLFTQFFFNFPLELAEDILKTTANFADENSIFFQPHLEAVLIRIRDIALNRELDESIRNLAILCFLSIAKGFPEMCKFNDVFFGIVLPCFVQIISEIDDDSPWEYDPNYSSPCQTALDVIGSIFELVENPLTLNIVFSLMKPVLTNSETPWQIYYAFCSMISEIPCYGCLDFFVGAPPNKENDTKQNENKETHQDQVIFFNFLKELMKPVVHPRVRISVLDAIKSFFKQITSNFPYTPFLLPDLTNYAINDEFPEVRLRAFSALNALFHETIFCSDIDKYYIEYISELIPKLIEEIPKQPIEIKSLILKCIGRIMSETKNLFTVFLNPIIISLVNLIKTERDFSFQVRIMRCASLTLSCIEYLNTNISQKAILTCMMFFKYSLVLYNRCTNEKETKSIILSLKVFITLIGKEISPYVQHILPHVLQNASKPITIERVETFNNIYGLASLFINVPSIKKEINNNTKSYVSRSEVIEVANSLSLLASIIQADPNSQSYVENASMIAKNWICNEFIIEGVITPSWHVLYASFRRLKTPEFSCFYMECYITLVSNILSSDGKIGQSCYSNFLSLFVTVLILSLKKNIDCNPALIIKVLQVNNQLLDMFITEKLSKCNIMKSYQSYDINDKEVSFITQHIGKILTILEKSVSMFPEIVVPFIAETLLPKATEYLNNFDVIMTGIEIMYIFLKNHEDSEKAFSLIQYLMTVIPQVDQYDVAFLIIEKLGCLLAKYPIPDPQFADSILMFLNDIIIQQGDHEQYELNSDHANVALAKLIKSSFSVLDHVKAAQIIIDCSPLWHDVSGSSIYYSVIADLIAQKVFDEAEEDWVDVFFQRILNGYMNEHFRDDVAFKFAQLFRDGLQNPQYAKSLETAISELDEIKMSIFNKIMSLTGDE
ncbi:hypothetical protein TRFO_21399 [Tritrichomonas foetus]|uniref:Importin N-terminal domain-containing protein n=1 Tax=Tritrichomonas foetus TaxID=1144522 RepID=A0A1J4KIN6_9EUKA|nr:hypothetical protein TRFO_21399 [Tritrichomonas foetus]|eukprot:OHT09676.1 hypothetical protein TRFO_21399 [Tritrichomonas foetus]